MSAADRREELEAAIWQARREVAYCRAEGPCENCERAVRAALSIADTYAEVVADERIAGRVHERIVARQRLNDATVEASGGRP